MRATGHHGSLIDQLAAEGSGPRTEVDEVVSSGNHGGFMLDDDQRIALIPEAVHDGNEAVDVPRMEAYGGFIKHKKSAGERGSEAGG